MRFSLFLLLIAIFTVQCKKQEYSRNDNNIDSLIINIPNSFSPEYSGPPINYTFKPILAFGAFKTDSPNIFVKAINFPLKKFEMEIRDVDNNKLFFTNDYTKGWDGMVNNKAMCVGQYKAYIHLEGVIKGVKNMNTSFLLIR